LSAEEKSRVREQEPSGEEVNGKTRGSACKCDLYLTGTKWSGDVTMKERERKRKKGEGKHAVFQKKVASRPAHSMWELKQLLQTLVGTTQGRRVA
jgi:hypothetical protein